MRAASQSAELTTCTNKISCDNKREGDRVARLIRVPVRDMVDTIAYTPRGASRAWQQETLGEAIVTRGDQLRLSLVSHPL